MPHTSVESVVDLDRLLKLRVIVARVGEMDLAQWWNTKQLGPFGAAALRRGFPRTYRFAAARSVLAVAAHRCDEVFNPPECVTLWHLPEVIEAEFDERWEHWLDEASRWSEFFGRVESIDDPDPVTTGFTQNGWRERIACRRIARRFEGAMQARVDAYTKARTQLTRTPGWTTLPEEVQRVIAAPLQAGMSRLPTSAPIPLLRSERDACEGRLRVAIRAAQEALEGERLAPVHINSYFAGGIETEEQLDSALAGLREECVRLIGAGKKVVLS